MVVCLDALGLNVTSLVVWLLYLRLLALVQSFCDMLLDDQEDHHEDVLC